MIVAGEAKKMKFTAFKLKHYMYGVLIFGIIGSAVALGIQYRALHYEVGANELAFEHVGSGTGITPNGVFYSLFFYRGSDGGKVTFFSQDHESPAVADGELARLKKSATRTVEEGPVLDNRGNTVGRRVVLRLDWGPIYLAEETLWTDRPHLRGILSRYPADMASFETSYKSKGLP